MSKELTSIEVPQSLTVKELAVLLDVDPIELVKQFNEKYGRGTLDLESGTFSPSN